MPGRPKILLLDDDQDILEIYREMMGRLPSEPEIHTATSGARAIALLESQPFALLISDLNMPRMDGLQVLTIVRRKFPQLRTAVMTSVVDTQFRARAYAMGIDLFLEKPNTPQETAFFMDCIESLLGRQEDGGFRGVQSKSLVDIIQLECLSQSSTTLKVTHGAQSGKIWFVGGEVIAAEVGELKGEEAFHRILGWRTGSFEILPVEPTHERTIFASHQGLLLESAQALDEAQANGTTVETKAEVDGEPEAPLTALARLSGVDFVVHVPGGGKPFEARGLENPGKLAEWVKSTVESFREVGEELGAGQLAQIGCQGPLNHLVVASKPSGELGVGFRSSISSDRLSETMAKVIEKWDF